MARTPHGPLILGCDPASVFGWGLIRGRGRIDSGSWDFAGQSLGARCEGIRNQLWNLLFELPEYPVAVAYEEVHHFVLKRKENAKSYGAIVGVIEAVAYNFDIPVYQLKVTEVKKVAGYGKATKDQMIALAKKKWTYEPIDDNDADAMWIAESCRILYLGS